MGCCEATRTSPPAAAINSPWGVRMGQGWNRRGMESSFPTPNVRAAF